MIKKLLVANRGEIAIRVMRACYELGIRTVAIYAKEDETSVHRFKADEAYLVGEGQKPVDAYLDIESIIAVAKDTGADAIHPGYGFLSENIEFAKRCREEGIIFVGPKSETLDMFGDKVKAKAAAKKYGIQAVPGSDGPVNSADEVIAFGDEFGYPIMVKAALGGGGRGMRVIRQREDVQELYDAAISEATKAFGSGAIYVEKYIEDPKHIEVQILGDEHGNVMHLWERDCSVQRRHQKVVEVAPTVGMKTEVREALCEAARVFMEKAGYVNAGTVEFLLDGEDFYFIEVNPRVQVEHTITEQITGVDIVQAQIRIAAGQSLHDDIGIPAQADLPLMGFAIQCRITTEDPTNNFMPDTGKINTYRSPGGFGVRLDAGNGFQNAIVSPYYDSMLTKLITHAMTFEDTVTKMNRALREYRIRGVENNIPFMRNVLKHPIFRAGEASTTFIDNTPELYIFPKGRNKDRGNKMLRYIADTTVNGFPGLQKADKPLYQEIEIGKLEAVKHEGKSAKQILDTEGVKGVQQFIKNTPELLFTDTTMRDAHQSLIATRLRTRDMVKAAKEIENANPNFFSMEVWGGATFDTSYRFLTEDPWNRLEQLRAAMPNTLLQMLFRGSNGVGYSAYPDNLLNEFIQQSAKSGIDVFRIFDSLNWTKQMEKPILFAKDAGKIAEAAMCYTGDILDPKRNQKYSLDYYIKLAKELETMGADIIAVKDMAGLLKPQAAYALISELKAQVDLPIHLHTHDTAGNGIMTYVEASRAGVDIVDVATSAFSSTTSQPSMSTLYYALEHDKRTPKLQIHNAQKLNQYWAGVRTFYEPFASGLRVPETEIYNTEMPGGQYTNLQQQARGVGLENRWDDIKKMYHDVNLLFGDIIKVTPSSKVVGDMTLFMVQNEMTIEDFYTKGKDIDFPASVIELFQGKLGQPVGGLPQDVKDIILKGEASSTERPGDLLEAIDFEATKAELIALVGEEVDDKDVISYLLYPKVFLDYRQKIDTYADLSNLNTPTFFGGMRPGETLNVQLEKGKVLLISLIQIGEPDNNGNRLVLFDLNGQRREIIVQDLQNSAGKVIGRQKADTTNRNHIGATMPGTIIKVNVKAGDVIKPGDTILITESMKMETTIKASVSGVAKQIHVDINDTVETGDLLIELEVE